jgi:hypothetical protein
MMVSGLRKRRVMCAVVGCRKEGELRCRKQKEGGGDRVAVRMLGNIEI